MPSVSLLACNLRQGVTFHDGSDLTAQDVVTYCLAVEELARGSLSVAAACTMQSLMIHAAVKST